MATRSQPHFRFMDLPVELRLMIYERLPRQIQHTKVTTIASSSIILITRHPPTAILRTSTTVYNEARRIVSDLIRRFVEESQPKIIELEDFGYSAIRQMAMYIEEEREQYLSGIPYHVKALLARHPLEGLHLVDPNQALDIARFIHQSARATPINIQPGLPLDRDAWCGSIATVVCSRSPRYEEDRKRFFQICRFRNMKFMLAYNRGVYNKSQHHVTIKSQGLLACGEGKAPEPTAVKVPMTWDVVVVLGPSDGAPKPSMSKEEWVGEWLCS